MHSCNFQHLLAGQVESNAAKTSQHVFKAWPRTSPGGWSMYLKWSICLVPILTARAPGGEFGVWSQCFPAEGRAMVGVQDAPILCQQPLACTQLCHWHMQPCPRAALSKFLGFLPDRISVPRAPQSTGGGFWSQQSTAGLEKWQVTKVWCSVHLSEHHQDLQDFASSAGCWVLGAAPACPNTSPS